MCFHDIYLPPWHLTSKLESLQVWEQGMVEETAQSAGIGAANLYALGGLTTRRSVVRTPIMGRCPLPATISETTRNGRFGFTHA